MVCVICKFDDMGGFACALLRLLSYQTKSSIEGTRVFRGPSVSAVTCTCPTVDPDHLQTLFQRIVRVRWEQDSSLSARR